MANQEKRSLILLLWLLMLAAPAMQGQHDDRAFLNWLMQGGDYRLAIRWMDSALPQSLALHDSILLQRGQAHYYLQELDQANNWWSRIDTGSSLYLQALMFRAWNLAFLGDADSSGMLLSQVVPPENHELDLWLLQMAGISLLQKNIDGYRHFRNAISRQHPAWTESLKRMDELAAEQQTFNPRSYWLAGISSALVPGSGKIYTGETGSGISTFLLVGALAAMTVENGLRSGWIHWNTLAFGGLFMVFHVGNIYGSLMSIKEYRARHEAEIRQRILWNMHMPLRDYYW